MFGFLFKSLALAVPVQLSQQGRLLDSNSIPVEGNHVLTVHLYDASVNGNFVWGENISVVFYNGFYQILTDQSGLNSWPIVATTFILLPKPGLNKNKKSKQTKIEDIKK